jgi:hypothetical protein
VRGRRFFRPLPAQREPDPQKALEADAKLRAASDLSVAVQRSGKDATIAIHIR